MWQTDGVLRHEETNARPQGACAPMCAPRFHCPPCEFRRADWPVWSAGAASAFRGRCGPPPPRTPGQISGSAAFVDALASFLPFRRHVASDLPLAYRRRSPYARHGRLRCFGVGIPDGEIAIDCFFEHVWSRIEMTGVPWLCFVQTVQTWQIG